MRAFVTRMSDIRRCPIGSLQPEHYNTDGTCRCRTVAPGDDTDHRPHRAAGDTPRKEDTTHGT